MLERVAWARSEEERLQIRLEKEVPIFDELIKKIKERLVDGKLLPKSKFREALRPDESLDELAYENVPLGKYQRKISKVFQVRCALSARDQALKSVCNAA